MLTEDCARALRLIASRLARPKATPPRATAFPLARDFHNKATNIRFLSEGKRHNLAGYQAVPANQRRYVACNPLNFCIDIIGFLVKIRTTLGQCGRTKQNTPSNAGHGGSNVSVS